MRSKSSTGESSPPELEWWPIRNPDILPNVQKDRAQEPRNIVQTPTPTDNGVRFIRDGSGLINPPYIERTELLHAIWTNLQSRKLVFAIGGRGSGKTTIAEQLVQFAQKQQSPPHIFSIKWPPVEELPEGFATWDYRQMLRHFNVNLNFGPGENLAKAGNSLLIVDDVHHSYLALPFWRGFIKHVMSFSALKLAAPKIVLLGTWIHPSHWDYVGLDQPVISRHSPWFLIGIHLSTRLFDAMDNPFDFEWKLNPALCLSFEEFKRIARTPYKSELFEKDLLIYLYNLTGGHVALTYAVLHTIFNHSFATGVLKRKISGLDPRPATFYDFYDDPCFRSLVDFLAVMHVGPFGTWTKALFPSKEQLMNERPKVAIMLRNLLTSFAEYEPLGRSNEETAELFQGYMDAFLQAYHGRPGNIVLYSYPTEFQAAWFRYLLQVPSPHGSNSRACTSKDGVLPETRVSARPGNLAFDQSKYVNGNPPRNLELCGLLENLALDQSQYVNGNLAPQDPSFSRLSRNYSVDQSQYFNGNPLQDSGLSGLSGQSYNPSQPQADSESEFHGPTRTT